MAAWTEASIPDQTGRAALVTGANSGIGWDTARALAQRGALVVVACRSAAKADDARRRIVAAGATGEVRPLTCDLADLTSVRDAAAAVHRDLGRLDLLVNNAGVMALPEQRTVDGFEMQFGTNHLGHFALTGLLLDLLLATPGSRVVTVSSLAHRMGRIAFDDLASPRRYSPWGAYGQSKLANLLFTFELQRRLDAAGVSTIAVAAHPGVSRTNLGRVPAGITGRLFGLVRPVGDLLLQNSAMGALPTLRAATDPAVRGGEYYGPGGPGELRGHPVRVGASRAARDQAVAARLWSVSEALTHVRFEALRTAG